MCRFLKLFSISVVLLLLSAPMSFAQAPANDLLKKPAPLTRILFVFDASQSMYGRWQSDIKISIAKKLLSEILDSLQTIKNLQVAMRVYGHQHNYPPQVCDDTKLEVPFSPNSYTRIKQKLQMLEPNGTTPIAISLEQAADDFPACDNCRNIIILITDGIEECGGDPCAVSQALQKKGIVLKPFVIGIGANFAKSFECVGTYFDASNEETFRNTLRIVISQALNSTTAQINLLDQAGIPNETNVNMTFYDSYSGQIKYNYIHTLNNRGVPDTLVLDPLLTYNLVVHTNPIIKKDSIKLVPGKHTTIALDAPQGNLKLKNDSRNGNIKNIPCIIRKTGTAETINVQYFNQSDKYIIGNYDIEILCLPRIKIDKVVISQSKTTTVEVPAPGIAVIQKSTDGYGSLFLDNNNKLEWLYNLKENTPNESIILQPGQYKVIFRSKYVNRAMYTIEKSFKIESDGSVSINLHSN